MTTFQEHGSAVLAFLTSRLGHRDVAEDLLQETFVRAIRADTSFPNSRTARSYLMTTAHRLMIDRRRRKREKAFSQFAGDGAGFEQVADVDTPSPESASELSVFEDKLEAVLATLTPAHRDAFRLAVLQQKSYAEVAEDRGWSIEQVKTNVHRSRKKVIERMRDKLRPTQEVAP